jgi:DNA polymerase III delta prime subunit
MELLQHVLDNNSFDIPNLLFYGKQGVGKTSCILSFCKQYYQEDFERYVIHINASSDRSIIDIRNKVGHIAKIKTKKCKIIILDEADALTQDAMMALRIIMEEYTEHTRFCLLCNYPYKIIQPIKSRCLEVYFPDTIDYRKQEIINKFGQETIIPIDLIIDFLTDSTDSTIKTIYHSGYKPMNFLTTLTQYILKEYNPIPQGIFKCISKMEFNIHCGCNFYIQLIQLKHKLQKIIS